MLRNYLIVIAAILTIAYCRTLPRELRPSIIYDNSNIMLDEIEDRVLKPFINRNKRQIQGSVSQNSDGSLDLNAKKLLAGNEQNRLSAVGSAMSQDGKIGSVGGGLVLENKNGHALSATGRHIPGFGNQLTGAAKVNAFHNDNHNLDVNAFITKNIPSHPDIPSFNTKGGSLDYMYKNKVGAALGMSHTDLIDRTDYSAMGKLNLYRGRDDSLDFNAGFHKSMSPYMPKSNWEPGFNVGYTKYW